ncbi:MAG: hypothetical protein SFV51_31515 [Bryobacteraceae bacterium]|nr:hypothetical protein [Bryobacteraceae bacterium]
MSLRILIVPEDPTYNGAILAPLVTRMLTECGRPKAKVTVLENPRVQGYAHAKQQLPSIWDRDRHSGPRSSMYWNLRQAGRA